VDEPKRVIINASRKILHLSPACFLMPTIEILIERQD
jgi:hypothetical protein